MKRLIPTLSRFLILVLLLGGAYFLLSSKPVSSKVGEKLGGLTDIANRVNTSKISGLAKEKFVDQQPIISDQEKPKVLGENTSSQISDQAKQILVKTTEIIAAELENLPKKEAAKVLRQTCEQLATELEQ